MALEGSRPAATKLCMVVAAVPVFCTVKVAVVDWFTNGEAGERTSAEVSVKVEVPLLTVALTLLVFVAFPVLRARAENVCVPFATVVVSKDML